MKSKAEVRTVFWGDTIPILIIKQPVRAVTQLTGCSSLRSAAQSLLILLGHTALGTSRTVLLRALCHFTSFPFWFIALLNT